jgi:tripartite-type tricarboxylate transporter receptor subunit TctC
MNNLKKISKKIILLLCISIFGLLVGCGGQDAQNQAAGDSIVSGTGLDTSWPTRPVTIVVPFPAGGDTDFYARTYANFLQESLGQPFEVVNMVGYGGNYGATHVRDITPDGYTVLFFHTGQLFSNLISGASTLSHNDFAISNIANFDDATTLIAAAHMEITDPAEFLHQARANPGEFRVGVIINGFQHFVLQGMELAGDFSVTPVGVAGGGMLPQAILDGDVDFAVGIHALFRDGIERGDFVPLMVNAERRNPNFRYVSTVEDMGLTGSAMGTAYFFAFPPQTDEAILHRLSDTVAQIQFNEAYISAIQDAFDARPFFLPTPAVDGFLQELLDTMSRLAAN